MPFNLFMVLCLAYCCFTADKLLPVVVGQKYFKQLASALSAIQIFFKSKLTLNEIDLE